VGVHPAQLGPPMGPAPPPPPRTKWTRRVPHPVLIGHTRQLRAPHRSASRRAARRRRNRDLNRSQRAQGASGARTRWALPSPSSPPSRRATPRALLARRAGAGPMSCSPQSSFVRASTLSPCDAEAGPHEARRVTPRPTRSCDAEAGAARQERVWFCQKGVKGRGPGGRAPPCDDTRDYEKGGAGARPALRTAAARSCGRAGCVTAARHAAQGTACGTTSRGCCGRRAPPFPRLKIRRLRICPAAHPPATPRRWRRCWGRRWSACRRRCSCARSCLA